MVPCIKARTTLIIATASALFSLALYVRTAAPTVLPADGGEFQFVPYIAGIAHPTGYPLYTMLGWLWSHALPFGDVAYRMNLFSALWAAVAVALLYLTSLLFLRRASPKTPQGALHASALAATATLAVSQTFWSQAVIAEVYSLNAFFVVLTFYLLPRWKHARQACPEPVPSRVEGQSRGTKSKGQSKDRQLVRCHQPAPRRLHLRPEPHPSPHHAPPGPSRGRFSLAGGYGNPPYICSGDLSRTYARTTKVVTTKP